MQFNQNMSMLDAQAMDEAHWDEIVVVGPATQEELDHYEDEAPEEDSADVSEYLEEADEVDSVYDAPEPNAILAKRAEEAARDRAQLEANFPFMKAAMAFAARSQVTSVIPELELDEVATLSLSPIEKAWMERVPEPMPLPEPTVLPLAAAKPNWFSKLKDKVDEVFESFGRFLDKAVPLGSAAVVATTLGLSAETFVGFESSLVASAPVVSAKADTVQLKPVAEKEATKLEAKTLAETQPDAASLNSLLIEKNEEIVRVAGGTKANYLFSASAHAHLTAQLTKATGFTAILNHPEVKKAKNIAEMVNLVDQYFGEDAADLIESNAAAMHLSVSDIAALS